LSASVAATLPVTNPVLALGVPALAVPTVTVSVVSAVPAVAVDALCRAVTVGV